MSNNPKTLKDVSWHEFEQLSFAQKAPLFSVDGRPFHVLIAQQFDRVFLDRLCELATWIRQIAKTKAGLDFLRSLLTHKAAMLYFSQPSTRTFLSFHSACQILGMRTVEVRDTSTSSELKGETQEDSIRTFSSFSDLIIMRSAMGGLAEKMAWVFSNAERPVPIVNAGSGKDQHPTQALLDIYTLQRSFEKRGGIDGKTIVFVGDLARGRTVRSLAYLLTNYTNVRQIFVAPETLQIGADILNMLQAAGVAMEQRDELETVLDEADAVYMTRVQDEWDVKGGPRVDVSKYQIGLPQLAKFKQGAVLLHPLPRRSEILPEVDSDPRAVYWRQVRNGMWVRVALLAEIFNVAQAVRDFHGG